MKGDHETDRRADVAVIWFGHGVELAQRLQQFIADRRANHACDPGGLLGDLDDLLHADFDPLTDPLDRLPLRTAVPPNAHPGAGTASEPGS